MLKIYGFNTQNNKKVVYLAKELGLDFEFVKVDLMKRENRSPEFLKMNPVGKVPVLEHDGKYLFESGAICRYIATLVDTPLAPKEKFEYAQVDQWMEFFTNHLGRWLNTLFFEKILRPFLGIGSPVKETCEEAENFISQQMKVLEGELSKREFIASNELSIADIYAYAYIEQTIALEMDLSEFPHTLKWRDMISKRESIVDCQKYFN